MRVCVCAPVHVCAFPCMFMLGCARCSFCMVGGHQVSGVWAGLRKEGCLQTLALGKGTAVLASLRGQKMTRGALGAGVFWCLAPPWEAGVHFLVLTEAGPSTRLQHPPPLVSPIPETLSPAENRVDPSLGWRVVVGRGMNQKASFWKEESQC